MRQKNSLVVEASARVRSLRIRVATVVAAAATLLLAPAMLTAPQAGLHARVRSQLERREYHASQNRAGLQAPNRAQNLRTYFETTGIRVHDRTAPGAPELLALSLAGVGRGDALALAVAGENTTTRHEIRQKTRHDCRVGV